MLEILIYLFYNYGKVRLEEVAKKEAKIKVISWQPADPIVLLTRLLEQLQKLAIQANISYADSQILEKELSLVRVTCNFENALT